VTIKRSIPTTPLDTGGFTLLDGLDRETSEVASRTD